MPADLFDRFTAPAVESRFAPDAAFAARPRLVELRDALSHAAKRLSRPHWNEPPVFFFDPKRQAQLEAASPAPPERFAELTALIATEMPALFAQIEVRRVARTIDGLASAARSMALHCPAARELTDLLAVPDDEVFLVLTPASRTGLRLHLRGAADVTQLRRLLADPSPTPPPRGERLQTPTLSPPSFSGKGVGGLGSSPSLQLFAPAALQADGTLPLGFAGCEHWLWPTQPLSAVPRIDGERVVLVGPAVVQASDAEPRFLALAVEAEVIQTLNPFQTTELLSRLCGRLVPVQVPVEASPVARAA